METNLAYEYEEVWEELIDGKVVAMGSPTTNHNRISGNIYHIFRSFLRGRRCEAFHDGMDVYLSKKDRYIPDVMVVCDPNKVKSNAIYGAPDLVVEVLSPRTAKQDRTSKLHTYERSGVREYWIVSPDSLSVEQYVLEGGVFTLRDVYTRIRDRDLEYMPEEDRAKLVWEFPCSVFEDLTIQLKEVFERVD